MIIVGILILGIWIINQIVSSIVKRSKKLSEKRRLIITFTLRLITVLIIIYLLIEGLPFFGNLSSEFKAIITSSLSVAIAFASSGIFENLISGITLIILNPFELNDIIRIGDAFGAIRSIKLTKTIIETFDNVFIEIANTDVISQTIMKYSLKLDKIENFNQFKEQIKQAGEDGTNSIEESDTVSLKQLFETFFLKKKDQKIHNFTFTMEFDYPKFRDTLEKIDVLCEEYKEQFGFKPKYHISNLDHHIKVNFRLMTLSSDNFFKYQPEFAKRLYHLVQKYHTNP